MSVKLLTEHRLKILSSKGGCTGSSESTLVKCHIVGNHMSMSRLSCTFKKTLENSENVIDIKGHILRLQKKQLEFLNCVELKTQTSQCIRAVLSAILLIILDCIMATLSLDNS